MGEGTHRRVLLSQVVLQYICSFHWGMDGDVKSLYETAKPLLDRLNAELKTGYYRFKEEQFDLMSNVYDLFMASTLLPNESVRLLPKAHLFKPMIEFTAMLNCDATLVQSLSDHGQLSDMLTGRMLAFVISKWSTQESTERRQREDIITIRQALCPVPLDYRQAMYYLANLGSLEGVEYLYAMAPVKYGSTPVDVAAAIGRLDIVEFFVATTRDYGSTNAMDQAATNGHLDVVRYLHENSTVGATKKAMDGAAANGHLKIVRFLHEHRQEGCSMDAVDLAATNGHLKVVKFLLDNRIEGHTAEAMDGAASRGHLDIVRFFHRRNVSSTWSQNIQRSLRRLVQPKSIPVECTQKAMDMSMLCVFCTSIVGKDALLIRSSVLQRMDIWKKQLQLAMSEAACFGYVEVLTFLLTSRGKPDMPSLMSQACYRGHVKVARVLWKHGGGIQSGQFHDFHLVNATENGHLQLVRFFVEQNHVKQVDQAVERAASKGHLDIVKFLVEHCHVKDAEPAVKGAATFGHLEIVKFLVAHCNVKQVQQAVEGAALHGQLNTLRFLLELPLDIDIQPVLVAAAGRGHLSVVKCFNRRVSKVDAVDKAAKNARLGVIRFFIEESELESKELIQVAWKGFEWRVTFANENIPWRRGDPWPNTSSAYMSELFGLCRYLESVSTPLTM
ncbi:hypothetical protein AeNC1_011058 [Aphanomyces euteiches]|nr:hypothetical protein AeNC1_011058 [Aphanomyces euteiches]